MRQRIEMQEQAQLTNAGMGRDGVVGKEQSRGMRRFAATLLRIVLAGLWFGLLAQCALAVQTTQVADTLYLADGTVASGTVLISWPTFTTAAGEAVPGGSRTVLVGANGALNVALAPNVGATPAGVYYTVSMHLSGAEVTTEYWMIPAATTTTLSGIRSKLIPVTRPVPLGGGTVSTAGLVEKAGDTMQGPLTLSGDPVSPTQATTKRYVDTGLASQQGMIIAASTEASAAQAAAKLALPKSGTVDVSADCGLVNDGVTDNYALWVACSAAHPTASFVWASGGAYYFSRDIYQAANQVFIGKGSCYNATTGVPVCGSTLAFAPDSAGLHQGGGAKMTDMNIVGGNPSARQSGAPDMAKLIIPDGQFLSAFVDTAVAMSRAGNVVTATTTYATWFVKNGIIKVTGAMPATFNGTFYITSATPVGSQSQITWKQVGSNESASVPGTIQPGTTGAAHGSGVMIEGAKVIDTNIAISNFANNCFEVTGSPYYTSDTGAQNAYAANPLPAYTSYTTMMEFAFSPATTNTSTTPTINVNGLGNKRIADWNGNALTVGALAAGGIYYLSYSADGTMHASTNQADLLISDDTQFTDSWTAGCGVAGLAVMGASDTSKGTYKHINNYFSQIYGLLGVPFLGDTYDNIQNSYDALTFWPYGGATVPLTSISTVAGLATVTTATPHGYKQGNGVIFGGTNVTSFNNYEVDSSGAVNAIVLTPNTPMASYTPGVGISFAAANSTTSAAPTINVSGLGAKTITDPDGKPLGAGQIVAFSNYGNIYQVTYNADGTFHLANDNSSRVTISCFISSVISPTVFQCQLPSDASTMTSTGGTVKLGNGDEILRAFGADSGSYSVGRHGYAAHNLVIADYTEGGQGVHNPDGCSVRFNETALVLQPHSGDCITGGSIIQSDVNYGLQLSTGVLTFNAGTYHFKPSGAPSQADSVTIDAATGNITSAGAGVFKSLEVLADNDGVLAIDNAAATHSAICGSTLSNRWIFNFPGANCNYHPQQSFQIYSSDSDGDQAGATVGEDLRLNKGNFGQNPNFALVNHGAGGSIAMGFGGSFSAMWFDSANDFYLQGSPRSDFSGNTLGASGPTVFEYSHAANLMLMSAGLQLAGDPSAPLQAATKQYVDARGTATVYAPSVTPAAVAAASCADQAVAVAGLGTSDMLSQIAPPAALGNVSMSGYVSAAGTLTLHFCNVSASSVTPPAGVYSFRATH